MFTDKTVGETIRPMTIRDIVDADYKICMIYLLTYLKRRVGLVRILYALE